MKIKYLKAMHNANIGAVLEVTDFEANILIKTGVAEPFEGIKYLQNLNFTPVVDDFGSLVVLGAKLDLPPLENAPQKPKAARKPKAK
ncbi:MULTISPECIES: hypothetical protein [Acinetobacter]|uniref:Uncharacterized protein n=1 Tax=Acinetobacter chengduensis TaxID=2420890 RepID=A0ABX9TRQ7_9GAMM|nr:MULTISPECIES: hypothetical protein [Acinetobacter]MBI1450335.1 hypothetical protein [Acinetobacter sp. FL51]RLL18002.1 hypothetical protein D9K81_16255 [Acinetobacter chengduensis]